MKNNIESHYRHNLATIPPVTRLNLLKSQLNQLSQHQLSELKGAIDAKLDTKPDVIISDEESEFLQSIF